MKKTITMMRFVNPTNKTIDCLSSQEVRKITPVNDKNGKPYIMVDYYDDEFCLNATMFCEEIKIETKEVENI